jgi:hypothetical protein
MLMGCGIYDADGPLICYDVMIDYARMQALLATLISIADDQGWISN